MAVITARRRAPCNQTQHCRQYDQRLVDQVAKQQRDREDAQSSGFIAAQIRAAAWKRCPTCSTAIEKIGGCAQVTCKFFPSSLIPFIMLFSSAVLTSIVFFRQKRWL